MGLSVQGVVILTLFGTSFLHESLGSDFVIRSLMAMGVIAFIREPVRLLLCLESTDFS